MGKGINKQEILLGDIFGLEADKLEMTDDEKRVRNREIDDVKWLLNQPQFRRYAWRWLGRFGVFRNPYANNSSDMSKNCGYMLAGQHILAEINEVNINSFAQMQREHISEAKSREKNNE